MTTKQLLYTGALTELGDRSVSTSESSTSRRVLDDVYDKVLAYCLKAGSWNFATESVQLDADTGVSTNFGDDEVFAKPTDFVRLHAISGDEDYSSPLLQYTFEQDYIVAPVTPIYIKYVSNDTGLGLDLNLWPEDFARYVELELAARVGYRITQDRNLMKEIKYERDKARRRALNYDAMDEASTKFFPMGSWNASRSSRSAGRERGRRNQLIG